jgi:hypothetical protein
MARSIGITTIISNGAKARNPMNLQKLLSKGHLVPIYEAREDTIFLIGYRRKASSRKAHQRPFMLKAGVPLGKITPNPETFVGDQTPVFLQDE